MAPTTLTDDEIRTDLLATAPLRSALTDDTDGTDADGTDGSDADGTDGTDGSDADGTDGTDADGTDGAS